MVSEVVRISCKEEITYSGQTQEYSDFFQDHQLGKERELFHGKQKTVRMI